MINKFITFILASIFPKREGDLLSWLANFKVKIGVHGATLGLLPATVTDKQDKAQALHDKIEEAEQKKQDWKETLDQKKNLKKTTIDEFSNDFVNYKTLPGYTTDIGQDLGIISLPVIFDEDNFKPEISVKMVGGRPEITWEKNVTDGSNIYSRLRGESTWVFLGTDNFSPYVDTRPLTKPGSPEEREYMCFGVIKNEQIGLQSKVVSIVVGEQAVV